MVGYLSMMIRQEAHHFYFKNERSSPPSEMPLKIQPLRCFHILQQARIAISVKQGPLKLFLAASKDSYVDPGCHGLCR
jgi:hypothetical protein